MAGGAACSGLAAWGAYWMWKRLYGSLPADGTVVEIVRVEREDIHIDSSRRGVDIDYHPKVSFHTESGEYVTFVSNQYYYKDTTPQFGVGKHVRVRYQPDRAAQAVIDTRFIVEWVILAFLVALGILLVVVGWRTQSI